jgi:hypothetical protein
MYGGNKLSPYIQDHYLHSQKHLNFECAKSEGPHRYDGGLFYKPFKSRTLDDVAIDKVLTDKDADEISFG